MRVYRVGHEEKVRIIHGDDVMTLIPAGPYNGLNVSERSEGLDELRYAHSASGSSKHHPSPIDD
ncbi:hypothetical protein ACFRLW_17710, partial [Streptomyces sp. NPDC056728]